MTKVKKNAKGKNVKKVVTKKEGKSNLDFSREVSNPLYISGLLIILLCLISGTYTLYKYENVYKYENSYLVTSKTIKQDRVVSYNNAKEYFSGLTGDYYIYIGYNDNKDVYNLEKKLRTVIKNYNLEDKFYYININNLKNDSNVVEEVNAYLGYRDARVSQVPTIIYVNKNNVVKIENIVARDDNNLMTVGDFQKILDINEISK